MNGKCEMRSAKCEVGNSKNGLSRRQFLGTVGLGVGVLGLGFGGSGTASASVGANERIRLGLIGCGGMGNRHLDSLVRNRECEVVAVCDVYAPRYEKAVREVAEKTGKTPDGYQDYRYILDRDDVDAVFCATPDHWHALITIHGCQAWKDVYVEKPVSTTVVEGRAMVNAARRYGAVVQVGTQQRSLQLFQDAVGIVQSGKLGEVTAAGAWVGVNGGTGHERHGPVPEGLDWDLWLGPAPRTPYSNERFRGFRAFHEYANGELTNWGVHLLDIVHWAIGEDRPLNVQAVGGNYRRLPGSDDYETIEALFEFKGCTVTWEQRHHNFYAGKGYGMKFYGTTGRLFIDRASFVVEPASLGISEQHETGDPWIDVVNHHRNFFEAIRTRSLPNADIEQAHRSTTTCLLAGIALDCRRKLDWDGDAERFVGDDQASRYLYRPYRAPWHL